MKFRIAFLFLILVIFSVNTAFSQSKEDSFLDLTGPYLGQKLPGMKLEIFAAGIVSTGMNEYGCAFTPDGKECYWSIWVNGFETIAFSKLMPEGWTNPEIAEFCGNYSAGYPSIHPDGSRL